MNTKYILSCFEDIANQMKEDFTVYMWGEDMEGYGEWIADDPSGVADFGEGSYFFHLSDMYDVLKYQYNPDTVKAHYEYSVAYRGENSEYGINLKTFSKIYDGSNIDRWAIEYHRKRDIEINFWESPEGKKKEEEIMKPIIENFKKEIDKFTDKK